MGYNLESLAPQLYPNKFPGGVLPPVLAQQTPFWYTTEDIRKSQIITKNSAMSIQSGFLAYLTTQRAADAYSLSTPPRSALKLNIVDAVPKKVGAANDPPFGKGILVTRSSTGQAIVSSVPTANSIYRDVYTSVFNRSSLLSFTFIVHSSQQDAFYFVKEETWRAAEDKAQLKRLQGQVNTTFHEIAKENGSGNNYFDVKIHGPGAIINLRYGTTEEKEKQRLLHHAKLTAIRKAWHREKEALRNGFSGSIEWSPVETDEIVKDGFAKSYDGDYIHNVQLYPELAEDPFNIKFIKKQIEPTKKRRKKRSLAKSCIEFWWFYWNTVDC